MANEITPHNDPVNANRGLTISKNKLGASLLPENFAQVMEFASVMKLSGTAIPKHLRDNAGACMAVAMQAFEWGMSPFAVANKSYSVNDRVAYEAQLIAAVVNTRSGIEGRLDYEFEGEGLDLRCVVTGRLNGKDKTYRSPRIEDIKPQNSPLWKNDPEQQLCYYSARAWARRHVPEVILGVYDRDEVEDFAEPEVIPPSPPAPTKQVTEKPKAKEAEIIEVDPPAPKEEAPEEERTYGEFETLGDFMTGLEIALGQCQDEIQIEEIWTEFDPMAILEGDEDSQQLAVTMKAKAIDKMSAPSAPLFSDQ